LTSYFLEDVAQKSVLLKNNEIIELKRTEGNVSGDLDLQPHALGLYNF
jgi:hypothetical protein